MVPGRSPVRFICTRPSGAAPAAEAGERIPFSGPSRRSRVGLLAGDRLRSLADLNQQAHTWMEKVNRQVHSTTREIPYQRLAEERLLLLEEQARLRHQLYGRPPRGQRLVCSEFVCRGVYLGYESSSREPPVRGGHSILLKLDSGTAGHQGPFGALSALVRCPRPYRNPLDPGIRHSRKRYGHIIVRGRKFAPHCGFDGIQFSLRHRLRRILNTPCLQV